MAKKKNTKAKAVKRKRNKIPCPDCGTILEYRDNDELYCPQCGKTRYIPMNMRSRLKLDSLSKPMRFLLVLLTLFLVVATARAFLAAQPQPRLNDELMDEALGAKGAHTGVITVSLLWESADDLDLRVRTPGGDEVSFAAPNAGGGILDVEANRYVDQLSAVAVENIYFPAPREGEYLVSVENFLDRTSESATEFMVRITVGETVKTCRGTLNGDGATADVFAFIYEVEQEEQAG